MEGCGGRSEKEDYLKGVFLIIGENRKIIWNFFSFLRETRAWVEAYVNSLAIMFMTRNRNDYSDDFFDTHDESLPLHIPPHPTLKTVININPFYFPETISPFNVYLHLKLKFSNLSL